MKKVLLVAVAGMFVLASCKKDRTCECSADGETAKGDKYINVTKKFMTEQGGLDGDGCVSYETTDEDYLTKKVTTTKVTCVIK